MKLLPFSQLFKSCAMVYVKFMGYLLLRINWFKINFFSVYVLFLETQIPFSPRGEGYVTQMLLFNTQGNKARCQIMKILTFLDILPIYFAKIPLKSYSRTISKMPVSMIQNCTKSYFNYLAGQRIMLQCQGT